MDSWRKLALCKSHPEVDFYPHSGDKWEKFKAPLDICEQCPVRLDCLEHALENRELHGIWGGTSERERIRILSSRYQRERRARMGPPRSSDLDTMPTSAATSLEWPEASLFAERAQA